MLTALPPASKESLMAQHRAEIAAGYRLVHKGQVVPRTWVKVNFWAGSDAHCLVRSVHEYVDGWSVREANVILPVDALLPNTESL